MRVGFRDSALEQQFLEEGYTAVPFLNDEELARVRRLFEESNSGCTTGFYSTLWSSDLEYRKHVHDVIEEVFHRPIQRFLTNYRMCLANFAVKHPQKPDSKVPIHQDWSMVDESKYYAVAIWCPLVDVDSENGCLAVVPRSHRVVNNIRANHPNEVSYSPFRDIFGRLEEEYLREIPLAAGDAILYQQGLLHGSRVNQSQTPRAAIVAVFIPDEASVRHYYQTSETEIQVYDVESDFYWKSVRLAHPPDGQRLVETITPNWKSVTESDVAAMQRPQPV